MTKKDSAHSFTINILRSRTFARELNCDIKKKKSTKNRAFEKTVRKPSDASLRNFCLTSYTPLRAKAIIKDDSFLSYKMYLKKRDSHTHKQRSSIKLHDKYKIINTDLRNRLHVEHPPNYVHAVTDIDNAYFQYMNAHPIVQYIPLYKSLKFQFDERFRIKQEVGYLRDNVLNIEENHRKELHSYECSVQRYMEQVKQFDAFISKDYQKSMACLKNCEALEDKVSQQVSLIENLANEQFTIQSRLIGIDYLYFMQQKYGRFLYYLSPPTWRAKHRKFARSVEIEAKGFDLGTSNEEDTFNVILEKMQRECCSGLIEPVLYFSHPDDLMALFESLEQQQLHHFSHVTYLAPHAKTLNKTIKTLKSYIEQDSALVVHRIEYFQKLLHYTEERETHLQAKFMKIIYGIFFDTVAETDVLKLQMHLEFCFEKLYAEKSTNNCLVSSAKALEKMYMQYSFELDAYTNDKVKMAMKKCVEGEKKKLRRAHVAARELRLFGRLEHALLRAFEPCNVNKRKGDNPLPAVRRHSTWKPKLQLPKPAERASVQRELTEEEIEYLTLFTDWMENENPINYLQSFTILNRNETVH